MESNLDERLLEWAPDAIVVVDGEGVIRLINTRTTELFGYEAQELVGKAVEILVPQVNREVHPGLRGGYVAHPSVRPMGAGLQLWAVRKDGTEFPVDISLSPFESEDGTYVTASIRNIADRLAVVEALREAREAAEQANRSKSEFLSRMSHELRTPLTAVLGFTELLQLDDIDDERRRDFVQRIHLAGTHLLALINDVLDLSRVETGSMSLSVEPVAVDALVADAVSLLEPLATTRGVRFSLDLAPVAVSADANRLRQVLINLLSNAVKYNRPHGLVTVRAEQVGDRVRIQVSDTGRGIDGADINRLFEPFERLGLDSGPLEESAEVEGTGIGLALSRGLLELMGGTISATSEAGVGSVFTVQLPAGTVQTEVADAHDDEPITAADADSKARVLYIEDNASNAILVESALSLRPHIEMMLETLGQPGFERAARDLPDLILLDLHLPDVSGREVLAWLRRDPRTAAIPVIVVSADATERRVRELLSAGAVAYVTKPLVMRDFLETVDHWIAVAQGTEPR